MNRLVSGTIHRGPSPGNRGPSCAVTRYFRLSKHNRHRTVASVSGLDDRRHRDGITLCSGSQRRTNEHRCFGVVSRDGLQFCIIGIACCIKCAVIQVCKLTAACKRSRGRTHRLQVDHDVTGHAHDRRTVHHPLPSKPTAEPEFTVVEVAAIAQLEHLRHAHRHVRQVQVRTREVACARQVALFWIQFVNGLDVFVAVRALRQEGMAGIFVQPNRSIGSFNEGQEHIERSVRIEFVDNGSGQNRHTVVVFDQLQSAILKPKLRQAQIHQCRVHVHPVNAERTVFAISVCRGRLVPRHRKGSITEKARNVQRIPEAIHCSNSRVRARGQFVQTLHLVGCHARRPIHETVCTRIRIAVAIEARKSEAARTVIIRGRHIEIARQFIRATRYLQHVAHAVSVSVAQAVAIAIDQHRNRVCAGSILVGGSCVVARRGIGATQHFVAIAHPVPVRVSEASSGAVVARCSVCARPVVLRRIGIVIARYCIRAAIAR